MFLRVLGAMVVADALDRRARRREHLWRDPSARSGDERALGATSRAEASVRGVGYQAREWDRRAPERVL
jgi:hypothetical protein